MMRISFVLLLALAACANASNHGPKSDPGLCGDLEAEGCVQLLDQQKITGAARLDALITAGNARLADDAPEYAIPFYDEVIALNPSDSGGHLFRAKGLAALAAKFHRNGGLIDETLAKGHYSMAGEEYAKAIKLAPDRPESYGPAVEAFLMGDKADQCGLAKAIRAQHETQFGQTEAQAAMVEMIKRRCGAL